MNDSPALKVASLSVELDGHTIIDDINFTVSAGSTTAIIGPNGAGKSVLLKAILRLLPKTSGQVRIFGIEHEKYRRVAPLLSYIPQVVSFDRSFPLTVQGLFSLKSPRPLGMSSTESRRAGELLDLVGASHLANQRLGILSGGQLQRVLLAYSLMDQPKLLLLDEPAAGIDVQGQETIYPLLARIQKEEQLTMVIVSHELEIVVEYADQVLCLNKKIMCSGLPHKVLSNETLQQMYGTPVSHFSHHHR
ncbi:MAG: metal ABC transporter ATP-binding protein [bacterium]